jgi:hypothetical protein
VTELELEDGSTTFCAAAIELTMFANISETRRIIIIIKYKIFPIACLLSSATQNGSS